MARGMGTPPRPRRIVLQRLSGAPVTTGGFTLIPQSRSLTVRLPFGAFVWQRPATVVVVRDGRTTRLPIRDGTRLAQAALIGSVLLLALAVRLLAPKLLAPKRPAPNGKEQERWIS